MAEFTLDTSGEVRIELSNVGGEREIARYRWHNLSPFVRGYVEALFASVRLFWLECPSCEWDCIVGPPSIGNLNLYCTLCAEDNGRTVTLRTRDEPLPATVEGADVRSALRFDRLSPEALALILRDCEARLASADCVQNTREGGRSFWTRRQAGDRPAFPPLTPYLSNDGKVCLR